MCVWNAEVCIFCVWAVDGFVAAEFRVRQDCVGGRGVGCDDFAGEEEDEDVLCWVVGGGCR